MIKYRKTASRQLEPKNRRHPELRLAAEIAGVSYWMAYKVMRGQAHSVKVEQALAAARRRLGLEEAA